MISYEDFEKVDVRVGKIVMLGKQVVAVVNFPPKQIGPFVSEVLTLGLPDENGEVVLLVPTQKVSLGGKMF